MRPAVRCDSCFLTSTSKKITNLNAEGNCLRLEAVLWAADGFNRSATKANRGWRSPYEVFFSRPPELQVVPFFQPGMMRVVRGTKSDAWYRAIT